MRAFGRALVNAVIDNTGKGDVYDRIKGIGRLWDSRSIGIVE